MPVPSAPGKRVGIVIGGVQKGGTTTLAETLGTHPALALGDEKELHWFDDEQRYAAGTPDPAPYHARFAGAPPGRRWIDASPRYIWWPPCARRIRDYEPAMRWILLLRNPVDRAYSQWNRTRLGGTEKLPFEDALDAEIRMMQDAPGSYTKSRSLLSRGFYCQQLERLFVQFPREQVLILKSEALRTDPSGTLARILGFLDLDPASIPALLDRNVGTYATSMDPGTRRRLVGFFESENRRLADLLGWNLADWMR